MNQKHAKWVEFLQIFTFVIKHTSGKLNKVVDAWSRINFIVQELRVGVVGFEEMVDMGKLLPILSVKPQLPLSSWSRLHSMRL